MLRRLFFLGCWCLAVLLLPSGYADDNVLRFAILSDIHVSAGNKNHTALKQAVAEINTGNYAFVEVNGDLSNVGADSELTAVKQALDQLRAPTYVIPGNHETNWSESAIQTFFKYWKNDRFVFRRGNCLFVGFDTGPYMKMGDGHVKAEDLHWLRRTLKENVTPQTTLIVFAHYPLITPDLDNAPDVIALLHQYHAAAIFAGHYHMMNYYNADNMAGIFCRSLFMNKTFGYSIAEIDG
ncbi:MAG: metallophosphoesterase, partial [Victivallales bacterium]|nr:metallophosphoesterase [Victivallales bacterium]